MVATKARPVGGGRTGRARKKVTQVNAVDMGINKRRKGVGDVQRRSRHNGGKVNGRGTKSNWLLLQHPTFPQMRGLEMQPGELAVIGRIGRASENRRRRSMPPRAAIPIVNLILMEQMTIFGRIELFKN